MHIFNLQSDVYMFMMIFYETSNACLRQRQHRLLHLYITLLIHMFFIML